MCFILVSHGSFLPSINILCLIRPRRKHIFKQMEDGRWKMGGASADVADSRRFFYFMADVGDDVRRLISNSEFGILNSE